MLPDVTELTKAVVSVLIPFLPFMIEGAHSATKKVAEVIAQKGGEAAWSRAQAVWARIKALLPTAPSLARAAENVATDPAEPGYRDALLRAMQMHIETHPKLALELAGLLGNEHGIQEIIVNSSRIEDVTQELSGSGKQSVKAARGAVVRGVRQKKD
jgi:hypothetical protein